MFNNKLPTYIFVIAAILDAFFIILIFSLPITFFVTYFRHTLKVKGEIAKKSRILRLRDLSARFVFGISAKFLCASKPKIKISLIPFIKFKFISSHGLIIFKRFFWGNIITL